MMKLLSALVPLFIASTAAIPTTVELNSRVSPSECYNAAHQLGTYVGGYSMAASTLAFQCIRDVAADSFTNDIYGKPNCVAAATANGVKIFTTALACSHPQGNYNATEVPHLDFGVYAQIVGDCAWDQPTSCPITQQKYIDFIYSQIGKGDTPVWPDNVDRVILWWNAITSWTATGNTSPYANFDDWLHYS